MELTKKFIPSKLSTKQFVILVLASAQILFGLLTIFCNQNIFYSLLESVSALSLDICISEVNIFFHSNWWWLKAQEPFKHGRNLQFQPTLNSTFSTCSMKKTFSATKWSQFLKRRDPTPSGKNDLDALHLVYLQHIMISREEQEKVNLVWHDDGSISYNRRRYWYFEPELSVGSLNDTVVSLNFPMITAVNFAKRNVLMQFGLSDILATVEVSY